MGYRDASLLLALLAPRDAPAASEKLGRWDREKNGKRSLDYNKVQALKSTAYGYRNRGNNIYL